MGERRIFDDKKGHAGARDTIRGGNSNENIHRCVCDSRAAGSRRLRAKRGKGLQTLRGRAADRAAEERGRLRPSVPITPGAARYPSKGDPSRGGPAVVPPPGDRISFAREFCTAPPHEPRPLPVRILSKAAGVFLVCGAIAACAMPRAQFTAAQLETAQLPGFPHVRVFADSPSARLAGEPAKLKSQNEFVFL